MIALARATPVVWVLAAMFSGPSDGTVISSPTALAGDQRWGEAVTVVRAYGATPLREGDLILSIDGRTMEEWVDRAGRASVRSGRRDVSGAPGLRPVSIGSWTST